MRRVFRSARGFALGASCVSRRFVTRRASFADSLRELLFAAACALGSLGGLACAPGSSGGESSGSGSSANPGDTVGAFELAAPSVSSFILHGTLPVPPRTFPRSDGLIPLQVRDSDGVLVPVQLAIVSRYPASADGADVVEVMARVQLPAGTAAGTRIRYDVVFQPRPRALFQEDAGVAALLATPESVTMRARDVFGNLYTADLLVDLRSGNGSLRGLKNGAQEVQAAMHESLLPTPPVAGLNGTLPHLLGVHTYVTQWSNEPYLSLDLRFHSAHSGLDQNDPVDDALGKVYFESLELVLPPNWMSFDALPNPFTGAPYVEGGSLVWPIVAANPGGEMHVMPQLSQFHRRLLIGPVGSEARTISAMLEEGLAFCQAGTSPSGPPFHELWSWWNADTARYFPQRHRLPSLDHVNLNGLRFNHNSELGARAAQIAAGSTGAWPTQETGLGWAHPWGIAPGGMVSGMEIHLYEGITTACSASNAGYRLAQVVHRMLSDRQPNVLFNADGRHTRMEDWILPHPQGDLLPVWWFSGPLLWAADPFGVTTSPNFQRAAVVAQGRQPPWEGTLLSYQAIDAEHLIRYTRMAKVLAWLGNDAIAKDDLRAQAEGVRMSYNMYRADHYPGGVISTGMLRDRQYADYHPGWGLSYGRAEGWWLDTMNAAYSLADPQWRATVRPWFDQVIDVLRDGQMDCTGIMQASYLNNVFNGMYRCRQSIEAAITENALVGMRESVFRGESAAKVAETNGVLERMLYAMISPLVWDPVGNGPGALFAVGTANLDEPPFCTFIPPDGTYGFPDHYQIWSSFAYGYEITGDTQFLNKAAEALGAASLLNGCMAMGAAEVENRAALLALVQTL